MRAWTCILGIAICLCGQAQVRINEVHASRTPGSDGQGVNGDWIELYNAGNQAVDLEGTTLALGTVLQRIDTALTLPARSFFLLCCDRYPELGSDHLVFALPRNGGSLLLIAADRTTVLDVFHWPSLPAGVSIGRIADGGKAWGFFIDPTPGNSNATSASASRCLAIPQITEERDGRFRISTPDRATIRYTTDNSEPVPDSPIYGSPVDVPQGKVLRARAFAANAVPSDRVVLTAHLPRFAMAVVVAPEDLHGPNGIADTTNANFARKGHAWQRDAWMQWGNAASAPPIRTGIAVAGSGSRGLPKKNFKLMARDRFGSDAPITLPDSSTWTEVTLRADATPNAFLRNIFMAQVARRSGSNVDVQPATPVPLYLNGRYHGLYRAMPAKGKEWVEHLNNGEAVELMEGQAGKAVSGKRKSYLRMLAAIEGKARMDTLSALIDLPSLIDLACFDLWTGRADHDLNVRCWRPLNADGHWRWILYDMDLWASGTDPTVSRMCSAPSLEAPYVPQLLGDPATRDLLLARISALMATTLSADRAELLADSLYDRYAYAMRMDRARWVDEMNVPSPEETHADLLDHVRTRNGSLLAQLGKQTGLATRTLDVSVEPAQAGTVFVEDLPLTDDERMMSLFANVPLRLTVIASPGMEFAGWKGADGDGNTLTVVTSRNKAVKAMFRPIGLSSQRRLKQGGEKRLAVGITQ
ncbi:MAG: CotH kinase family protein [Flavobacteriales bacterium]